MRSDASELRERVRERLSLAEVMTHDGVELRKAGRGVHKCVCPFHVERSASFVVGGKRADRGHCFGCGWDGDIFSYWQERRSVDFAQALRDLAGLAGVPCDGVVYERPAAGRRVERSPERVREGEARKPMVPPLRQLRPGECEELARVRGLSVEAVKVAAFEFKRIGATMWPLYWDKMGARWGSPCSDHWWQCGLAHEGCAALPCFPSWVATDPSRNVVEYRRLDGLKYERREGEGIKSWSSCGKNWPLGVMQIGRMPAVMLVEGGPDMIAAYHFLLRFNMLDRVAVVCMLGASNSIREEVRAAFKGKRVRIMQDADVPKDDVEPRKRKMPGAEASARWEAELTGAGAVVENFCVGPIYDAGDVGRWSRGEIGAAEIGVRCEGLRMRDGGLVKDVNDLARCGDEVIEDRFVREAFCNWEF